jgi:hypothetical protein
MPSTHAKGNTAVRLLAQALPALATTAIGPWAAHARCATEDPEIFFPPNDDPAVQARRICGRCPVRGECLAYALEAMRRKLRRRKDDTGSATEGAA